MKRMTCISLLMVMSMGCASYTTSEKIMVGTFIAAQAADYATTDNILDHGGRELNPVLGEHPSDTKLVVYKAIGTGVVLLMAHMAGLVNHEWGHKVRKGVLLFGTALAGGCAIHNYKVIQDRED